MSVGTETEKFWDSLWELQAECTGLLWVERHPWARGDLGQSAQRQRENREEEHAGPVWTQLNMSKVEAEKKKKEKAHTKADNTAVKWKR